MTSEGPPLMQFSKYQFHFFVQIEILCYSLRRIMGRSPSGQKTASSFRFLRVFPCFFTETHGRGLGLVAHALSD